MQETEASTIDFKAVELADKPIFDKAFAARRYENAHFNFTNLFMWQKAYDIQWTVWEDLILVKACWEGSHFVLPPFGSDRNFGDGVLQLKRYLSGDGREFLLRGCEKFMLELLDEQLPGAFRAEEDRDNFDYLYQAEDLRELKGRKFHKKKNHANAFRQSYPEYEYRVMDETVALETQTFLKEWCRQRDCEKGDSLDCERKALSIGLQNFRALGISGGAIYVKNEMKAVTFGEKINSDTAVVHAEKADTELRGIYTAICQDYCQHAWSDVAYINREEDMGEENLRKAKLAYQPIRLIEKYVLTANDSR